MKNIILIAPPAAGKGTQAKLFKEKYGYSHISTGDLLRKEALTNTFIASELSKGHFIDNSITLNLLEKELFNEKHPNGYILDGFPRNLYQAKEYEKIISKLNLDIGHIITIQLTKKEALSRVLGRLTCGSCGAVYNETEPTMVPKVKGICDKCDSSLYKRSDDNENSFLKRYETYLKQTEPVIEYFKQKYTVHNIVSINIETTFNKITEIIESGE